MMKKMRVHELSKELGIQSKDLIRILNELGAGVKNHMSTVDGEYLEQIRRSFNTGVKKGHTPARVNKQAPPKKDPKKEDARPRATDSKKKTTTSSGKKQSKTGEATKTKPAKELTLKKAEDRQKSTVKKSAKKEEPRREQRPAAAISRP